MSTTIHNLCQINKIWKFWVQIVWKIIKINIKSPRKIKLQNCTLFKFSMMPNSVSKIHEEALNGL